MTFADDVEAEQAIPEGSTTSVRKAALGRIADMLEDSGVDLEQIGKVDKVRINQWQGMYAEVVSCEACHGTGGTDDEVCPDCMGKQTRRVPRVVDMHSASVVLAPSWDTGPEWPLVQQPDPVTVKVPKSRASSTKGTDWKTCAILPDIQFGYRRLADGTLDPFHDERALDVALQIVEAERPDLTIFLGDVLDIAPMSRHRFEAGFALTMQPALDVTYNYLAQVSACSDETRYISGNHDQRIQNYITDNAMQAFGLRKAGTPPEDWPVMSVQHLLRLDELGIEYVGAYPAGATYINDKLACIHGAKIGNRNRTAAQIVVEDEMVSIIYGHTHKRALAGKTRNSRGEPKFVVAYSPGCLARIDGGVPSVKGGTDAHGRPIKAWEDWQQGLGIVRYMDAPDDHRFAIEDIPIFEGWAMHRGKEYTAR